MTTRPGPVSENRDRSRNSDRATVPAIHCRAAPSPRWPRGGDRGGRGRVRGRASAADEAGAEVAPAAHEVAAEVPSAGGKAAVKGASAAEEVTAKVTA